MGSLLRVWSGRAQVAFVNRHEGLSFGLLVLEDQDRFWTKLGEAEEIDQPFCSSSFLLQEERKTSAKVLLMF